MPLTRLVTATLLSCLLTALTVGKDQVPPVAEKPEGGLELKLTVKPTTFKPKTAIELVCSVCNRTDKTIQLADWGIMDVSAAIEVLDSDGHVVACGGGRNGTKALPANAFPVLKPGETKDFTLRASLSEGGLFTVHELAGGVWTWPLKPGSYQVKALFDVGDTTQISKGFPAANKEPLWSGKSHSPAVTLTVEP